MRHEVTKSVAANAVAKIRTLRSPLLNMRPEALTQPNVAAPAVKLE